MSRIGSRDLLKVSLRLAFLQSTWCEGSMQSIGLAYCLVPGLRRLFPSPGDLGAALRRYETPFNTHPFLAGIMAGAVLRFEESGRSRAEIAAFLQGAMGPVAALGDPFFFGALPAFVAVASSLAAMFGGVLAGVLTLLLAFNTVYVFVRFFGVFLGYREGDRVLEKVARWLSPVRTRRLRTLAAAGAGVVLIEAAKAFGTVGPVWILPAVGLGVAVLAVLFRGRRATLVYLIPAILAGVSFFEVFE